jgi:two-component system sensor histidine kinase HydH
MIRAPEEVGPAFNLRRRFALTSLGVILCIAAGLGWLLSSIMTERMLRREGQVSMEFIHNLLVTDRSGDYLSNPADPVLERRFLDSMAHLASMTEPVRANAYNGRGDVVWSTDRNLIGRHGEDNDELNEALTGRLVVHSGTLGDFTSDKAEHAGLSARTRYYVESYIPVVEPNTSRVLGVVELYKVPLQLNASIREGLVELWVACAASAVVLFVALNGVIRRADNVMREQQARLTESQALSSAVELAGAVAHNLRNPLASIRVSAELLANGGAAAADCTESCDDIMSSVDRANRWITELVRVSQAPQLRLEPVSTAPLLHDCLEELRTEMERSRVQWTVQPGPAPAVIGHPAMLRQILLSVLANAIEAMPRGGSITVAWSADESHLRITVTDTGIGISDATRLALFRPFFSTKSGGLGIGLALARRTLEQWEGSIDLRSSAGAGTCITISLVLAPVPKASEPALKEVADGAIAGH